MVNHKPRTIAHNGILKIIQEYAAMSDILNLRKKIRRSAGSVPEKKPIILSPPGINSVKPGLFSYQTAQLKQASSKISPQISWEAPLAYPRENKKYLVLLITGLSLGGAGMLFYGKDILTGIFLLLSALVLILHSNQKSDNARITINRSGIAINNIIHRYKDLESFWINYQPGSVKELSLESKKWYVPYIRISIENKNPLTMRSFLINFLPEKEHDNSLVDLIARRIGL